MTNAQKKRRVPVCPNCGSMDVNFTETSRMVCSACDHSWDEEDMDDNGVKDAEEKGEEKRIDAMTKKAIDKKVKADEGVSLHTGSWYDIEGNKFFIIKNQGDKLYIYNDGKDKEEEITSDDFFNKSPKKIRYGNKGE
nr:MAG TPA: alpha-aminoadipate carrier protein [Bacteriophage sp.]